VKQTAKITFDFQWLHWLRYYQDRHCSWQCYSTANMLSIYLRLKIT